jgi:hypothetical protein
MLTKTIGQLDSTLITDGTEYVEIEQSGASKKTTVQNIVYGGMPVGMMLLSEFEEATSVSWPAVPRNIDIDISPANYPLLATKLYDVKAKILGETDFVGVLSSANTSYTMITFVTSSAVTAMCTLLTEDAKVSRWMNLSEDATAPSVVDFITSATSRCINIAGTDYPIYPSTAASAISITSGTIIFEGKPAGATVTASIYTYRIPGTTNVRLRKIAGFVGVAAGDAGGEVVGGFRKMDRGQGHWHPYGKTPGAGTQANIEGSIGTATNDSTLYYVRNAVTDTVNGTPRTGKTTDPRTAGQYAYTWAGVYTP